MSIKTSLAYWHLGPLELHVFRSTHDGWTYATLDVGDREWQLWPPSTGVNDRTGTIGRWYWQRHSYHSPKPTTECNCWRCTLLEKREQHA